MYGCIYKLTNTVTGKSYIGKSKFIDRVINRKYQGSGILIKKMINQYGWNNFKTEIIDYALTREELNQREIFWIERDNSLIPNGYNMTKGGDGGIPSDEVRKKISESGKGRKFSENHKRKISESQLGELNHNYSKKASKETRSKMSKSKLGNTINRGRTMPKEVKEKISNTLSGKVFSEEHKNRISLGKMGVLPYNINIPQDKVICPFCKKEGGSNLMKRYHFDKCKKK